MFVLKIIYDAKMRSQKAFTVRMRRSVPVLAANNGSGCTIRTPCCMQQAGYKEDAGSPLRTKRLERMSQFTCSAGRFTKKPVCNGAFW